MGQLLNRGLEQLRRSRVAAHVATFAGLMASAGVWAADAPATAVPSGTGATLTAEQILAKQASARGGSAQWLALRTLSIAGKMEAGHGDSVARSNSYARGSVAVRNAKDAAAAEKTSATASTPQIELPFTMQLKRPFKSRLELNVAGQTAVQVYDGKQGWKLRPFLNRTEAEPFTPTESQLEAKKDDLEGPLLGWQAKGTRAVLEGTEAVDGHPAYKLKLTLKDGDTREVWIDSASFLDVKLQSNDRWMNGRMRHVYLVQRDFRAVQGLMIPFSIETVVDGALETHKMTVETANINQPIDDARFTKPQSLASTTAPVRS